MDGGPAGIKRNTQMAGVAKVDKRDDKKNNSNRHGKAGNQPRSACATSPF